jgi:hypothetical protein
VLDLLRGPRPTLLAFGPEAERTACAACADRAVTVVQVDRDAEVCRTYGLDQDTLVLVRPDGYIGLAAPAAARADLEAYVDRIAPLQGLTSVGEVRAALTSRRAIADRVRR